MVVVGRVRRVEAGNRVAGRAAMCMIKPWNETPPHRRRRPRLAIDRPDLNRQQ